jgi:hypothetical protein
MTVEAIKGAIVHLSGADRRQLARWFEESEERAWDEEIERDFSAGGRGMPLLAELEREIGEGKTRPIEEVCAERRKQEQRPR